VQNRYKTGETEN